MWRSTEKTKDVQFWSCSIPSKWLSTHSSTAHWPSQWKVVKITSEDIGSFSIWDFWQTDTYRYIYGKKNPNIKSDHDLGRIKSAPPSNKHPLRRRALGQDPISQSFHFPHWLSASTLSHLFFFHGCFYNGQSYESCGALLLYFTCRPLKVFHKWQKARKIYFLGC